MVWSRPYGPNVSPGSTAELGTCGRAKGDVRDVTSIPGSSSVKDFQSGHSVDLSTFMPMLMLTAVHDDRVPRISRVKCVLNAAHINGRLARATLVFLLVKYHWAT